ncbi:MAG: hypothetical protein IKB87_02460, partial [Clostridia bacterium]|nr:hypothetical protein [Clostridia bacterium]
MKAGDEKAEERILLQKARDLYAKALTEADANRKTAAEQKAVNEHARKAADALAQDGDADYDPLWEEESLVGKSMLDGGAQFSISGVREDGIEVYETSKEVRQMPYKQRMETFMGIMRIEYSGRTAKFYANGDVYYAKFDEKDLQKNVYGDKKSSLRGWKAKINTGADGNIFELVENAEYHHGKAEEGKKAPAHKNVSGWEYFVKTVQIDNQVYDLVANIRKKTDGEYVYSIQLNENKKMPASPVAVFANRNPALKVGEPGSNSISQTGSAVKEKYSVSRAAGENERILSDLRSILQNGGSAADLRSYVNTLEERERTQVTKKPQGTKPSRRGDAASEIVRAAHAAEMSVEEYLRENAELYETEDGWNSDARRALQMESGARYSIGGINAAGADMEALRRAKEMDGQGVAEDTIFESTGWFKGADGKWRFEIDDSRMEYRSAGDAAFMADHPEYAEYQELIMKMLYGTITAEEDVRMRELAETWGRERERLNQRVEGGSATLANLIKHDELFQNYPGLRNTKVEFADLLPGENGSYNPTRDVITLSSSLRRAPESTLLHEIQHVIQRIEGFAGGASVEYWADRYKKEAESAKETADKKYRELWDALPDEAKNKFREINRAKLDCDWDLVTELEDAVYESEYADMYSEITDADFERRWARERTEDFKKRGEQAYFNTAGEIEARDVSDRQKMTAEERREKMPNRGGKDVVFAERERDAKQAIGKTTDNRPVVIVEEDILDGVPQEKWVSTVKENLKKKFPDGVSVGKNKIQIDGQSRKEMTFSDYMQWLYNNDRNLLGKKLRATNNADEILRASTNWVNEGLAHPRKDKIVDFARGTVLLEIGGMGYSAQVVVGRRKNGTLILYDFLYLAPEYFVKKETDTAISANPSPGAARNTVAIANGSIPQSKPAVKSKLSVSAPEETFKKSQTKADSALKRTEKALLSRIGYELKKQKTPRIRSVSDDHRKLNRKGKKKQTQQFLRELHSSSSPRSISIGQLNALLHLHLRPI